MNEQDEMGRGRFGCGVERVLGDNVFPGQSVGFVVIGERQLSSGSYLVLYISNHEFRAIQVQGRAARIRAHVWNLAAQVQWRISGCRYPVLRADAVLQPAGGFPVLPDRSREAGNSLQTKTI